MVLYTGQCFFLLFFRLSYFGAHKRNMFEKLCFANCVLITCFHSMCFTSKLTIINFLFFFLVFSRSFPIKLNAAHFQQQINLLQPRIIIVETEINSLDAIFSVIFCDNAETHCAQYKSELFRKFAAFVYTEMRPNCTEI